MLYKNKGSREDPSKYRCIALLNHAYKVLSIILLGRLLQISDGFLKDWQAGFRETRGCRCRNNSMIFRVLCENMMELGKALAVVFIDYSAAFDSVSHKFVDEALGQAGASPKVRAIYRAICCGCGLHLGPRVNNKQVRCDPFPINRGVLQGDVTSPLFFIMTLELILRRHAVVTENKGAPLADIFAHLLGYADEKTQIW